MELVKETEYLKFYKCPKGSNLKTDRFHIKDKNKDDLLVVISWHGPWRKYTAMFNGVAIFDTKCLKDIINFIDELMAERKNKK